MKSFHTLRWMAAGFSCVGLLLPSSQIVADDLAKQTSVQQSKKRPAIADVALTDGGVFCGRVIDRTGKARGRMPITLKGRQAKPIRATTDRNGRFRIENISGGVYYVRVERGEGFVRLWSSKAAPPNTQDSLILVTSEPVIRGQNVAELDTNLDGKGDRSLTLTEAAIMATSVTAIVVGGVTIDKHNRLVDNIEKLPYTP
jgi:hypothetical protein